MPKTKKPSEFEYRLTMKLHDSERQQSKTTTVTIETTKAFASFRYELSVHEQKSGRELHYTILGLKAPQLSLPASGTALFFREYEDLSGRYDIIVESLDGSTNIFTVNITKGNIKILKSPKLPFIEFVAA